MKNCLCKKYGVIVENDNLPNVYAYCLDLQDCTSNNTHIVTVAPLSGKTVKLVSSDPDAPVGTISASTNLTPKPGYIYNIINGSDINKLTSETFFRNYADISNVKVLAGRLTKVTELALGGDIVSYPADNTSIAKLNIRRILISEDIKQWIKSQASCIELTLGDCTGTFTAKDLAALRSIKAITAGTTSAIAVEDYVAERVHLGDTELQSAQAIKWMYIASGSTFNDIAIVNRAEKWLYWSASGDNTIITFDSGTTTIHVNSDGTWTRIS